MKSSASTVFLGRAPRISVHVSQKVINEAVARNSNHCMVAEAIKEKYPELRYVSVDIQTIRATDRAKRERYVWLTPRSVQVPIIKFDAGIRPQPFGFQCREGQVIESGRGNDRARTRRAKLRPAAKSGGNNRRRVPGIVGGKTPPRSVGQRRAYGLRKLEL